MCQPQNVGGGVFLHWHEDGVYLSADDGRTWHGFRELYLDPRRDAADFGTAFGIDKSVRRNGARSRAGLARTVGASPCDADLRCRLAHGAKPLL